MSVYRVGSNKSSVNNFPAVRPTLDLDFANTKTLDPRITFTRGSGGSYVGANGFIKYAGVNEARFDHDPETGESLGLLIEEARTNLILHNTKHNEIQWINQGSSETINTTETLSPDGTNNATKLFGNNGITTRQSIFQGVSVTSGTTYTFSVFLKQGQRRYATIWFGSANISQGAFFGASTVIDLQTGTLATGSITKIIPYPNGWYRCYVTATPTATQSMGMQVSVGPPNNEFGPYAATGDGSSGIYIWGHQLEVGSFPTSYIPTQGSTRTRAADNARIIGKNFSDFYNRTESSIFVEYLMKGNFGTDGFNRVLEISDGTTQNRFIILKLGSASSNTYEFFNINNISELNFATIPSNYGSFYKYTVAFKENDFVRYRIDNTNVLRSNIDSTLPLSKFFPNQLSIGYESTTNSRQLNGYIRRLTYYPKRFPNSQLIALTR